MAHYRVKKLIIEVSFPNEMEALALASGHLTPTLLGEEIRKMRVTPEKIYIAHLKPFYRREIEAQLAHIPGVELEILVDGQAFQL